MKDGLLTPLTFRPEVEVGEGLREHSDRVNECRERRGYRGCSECLIYDECTLLKSLLLARFGVGGSGGSSSGD